jgi:hypothetical protein
MPLRLPESHRELEKKFCLDIQRRVSADHIVDVGDVHYEVPRGLAGQLVTLRQGFLDGSVSLLREGRLIHLAAVDLAFDARDRRGSRTPVGHDTEPMPVPGAAELSFNHRFSPGVDADGGCAEPTASKSKGAKKK